MTKSLYREFCREFQNDPDVFAEGQIFTEYCCSPEKADAYWQRQLDRNRVHLAIVRIEKPIGEIILKNINKENGCCELSIHMVNDSVKNLGYGTRAEQLTLEYAFDVLGMETVYANTLLKNSRSRHVLRKVGFQEIRRDDCFVYFRCQRPAQNA